MCDVVGWRVETVDQRRVRLNPPESGDGREHVLSVEEALLLSDAVTQHAAQLVALRAPAGKPLQAPEGVTPRVVAGWEVQTRHCVCGKCDVPYGVVIIQHIGHSGLMTHQALWLGMFIVGAAREALIKQAMDGTGVQT